MNWVIVAQGGKFGGWSVYLQDSCLNFVYNVLGIKYFTTHTSKFNGTIHWVQLDAGIDNHDHFIDSEERFRVAMARQ